MKTQIKITGQIAGNHRLHLHLQRNAESVERFFNDFLLTYKTKKEAYKALSDAHRNLKSLEPDFAKEDGISYRPGISLRYDASYARIL